MAARVEPLPPFLDREKAGEPPEPDRCGNCRYWLLASLPARDGAIDPDSPGLCRRYPPTPHMNLHGHVLQKEQLGPWVAAVSHEASCFPGTLGTDWCGEHSRPPAGEK